MNYFPEPIKYRKLHSDPYNEPKFDRIRKGFPLPHDKAIILQEARDGLAARGIFIPQSMGLSGHVQDLNETIMSVAATNPNPINFPLIALANLGAQNLGAPNLGAPGSFQMGRKS